MPISKALIYAKSGYTGHDSIKVDFMLVSEDYQTAYLVELKTDEKSVRDRQNEDLNICSGLFLYDILKDVLQVIKRTDERRKYMHLLKVMECNGLLNVSKNVYDLAFSNNSQGITAALNGVMINPDLEILKSKLFM